MKRTSSKKLLAVILSVLMLMSVMSAACTALAAEPRSNVNITYNVPDKILTSTSAKTAPYGMAFEVSLKPILGYKPAKMIVVKLDGTELDSGYAYDKNSGTLIINAEKMTGDIEISIEDEWLRTDPAYEPETPESPILHDFNIIKIIMNFFEKIAVLLHRLFGF